MEPSSLRSRLALAAAALLLAANVVVPLVWGDVYPFTSAPMFRDSPNQCCSYQVLAADGRELLADQWLVQRIYDGNPIGYGVGVRPPAVIEQEFGVVHDEAAVRRHVERQLAEPRDPSHESIEVVQQVIGPVDREHVGVVRTERWHARR
jgi:hypothetical protein